MNESPVSAQLGIYIQEDNVKIIEVESSATQQFRINKIVQTQIDTPLNVATICDEDKLISIGNQLQQIIRNHNLSVQHVIFTLDSQFTIIKKLPYDQSLSEAELIDQVDWEVKEFSYSPNDEYIVDFYRLKPTTRRNSHEMIVVAIREQLVKNLRKMFSATRIRVRVIDLDVFSATRAIEMNYDLRIGDIVALVEVQPAGLLFTIIEDKEYCLSQEVPLSRLKVETDSLDSLDQDEIAKFIAKELRRIILDNKLGEKVEDINRIFLYGDMVKDDILENLQNNYSIRIDRANPFRRLLFAPNVSVDENIWSRPETFTVCVGSALRKK